MGKKLLQVKKITKRFGGVKALSEVSFDVLKGEVIGIIGPNGAGKTTLFNIITGFVTPTSGVVLFKDINISKFNTDKIAKQGITRTFQNLSLFSNMSVLENIMVGTHSHYKSGFIASLIGAPWVLKENREIREKALGIAEEIGINDIINIKSGDLPLGKLRLVELARALAMSPEMLLLDEPASGLNTSETNNFNELLQKIKKKYNLTIVVVEHDMDFIMDFSNKIVVLNFGQIIDIDIPDKIQKNPKVIEAYLGV